MNLDKVEIIDIPDFNDFRGGMSFIENKILPFEMKRIYYLYNVPKGVSRGGHAHIEQFAFFVALNGSFDVVLTDTKGKQKVFKLDEPNKGLLIPNMVWRELINFSLEAVCLVLASDVHKEEDYIRDFKTFLNV